MSSLPLRRTKPWRGLIATAALIALAITIGLVSHKPEVTEDPAWNLEALAFAPYQRELTALEDDAEAIATVVLQGIPQPLLLVWFDD